MLDLIYTYKTPEEILKNIIFIKDFNIIEYGILVSLIIFFIIFVTYILPILYIIKEKYTKNIEDRKKKNLLKQIIMQKELEDEILKEIKKN